MPSRQLSGKERSSFIKGVYPTIAHSPCISSSPRAESLLLTWGQSTMPRIPRKITTRFLKDARTRGVEWPACLTLIETQPWPKVRPPRLRECRACYSDPAPKRLLCVESARYHLSSVSSQTHLLNGHQHFETSNYRPRLPGSSQYAQKPLQGSFASYAICLLPLFTSYIIFARIPAKMDAILL